MPRRIPGVKLARLTVDAIDKQAANYYRRFGFESITDNSLLFPAAAGRSLQPDMRRHDTR